MPEATVSGISVRIRRVTTQVAYVVVPLTEELVASFGTDAGKGHDSLLARQARLAGVEPGVEWIVEETPVIDVHPVQMAKPGTRRGKA